MIKSLKASFFELIYENSINKYSSEIQPQIIEFIIYLFVLENNKDLSYNSYLLNLDKKEKRKLTNICENITDYFGLDGILKVFI